MNKTLYPTKVQQLIDDLHSKQAVTSPELRQGITEYALQLSLKSNSQPDISKVWEPYLKKVTLHAYKTLGEDVDQLKQTGHSEDEIFELTLCAALGAGLARLESGLTALKVPNC